MKAILLILLCINMIHENCAVIIVNKCTQCYDKCYLYNDDCYKCPLSCVECEYKPALINIECTACVQPLEQNKPICSCKTLDKYINTEGKCTLCPYFCPQCTNDENGNVQCGTCSDKMHMYKTEEGICKCINPKQFINSMGFCADCSPLCKKCHRGEDAMEVCDECENMETMNMIDNACYCKNPKSYIGSDNDCKKCDDRCNGCYGPLNSMCIGCNLKMPYNIEINFSNCECDSNHKFENEQCVLVYSWKWISILVTVGVITVGLIAIIVCILIC